MVFTPQQQTRIQKLVGLLGKDQAELLMHVFSLEDKFDASHSHYQDMSSRIDDFLSKVQDIEDLRPKKGEDYPSHEQIQKHVEALVATIPPPKDADEKKITENVISEVVRQIKIPKDGKDAIVDYDSIIEEVMGRIELPKDGSPDTAEDIRNKLELLEGDERLAISAIRDLDKKLKEFTHKFTDTSWIPRGITHNVVTNGKWGYITGDITSQTDLTSYIASQITSSDEWSRSGGNLYPTTLTDNVGIGIAAATARLDVRGSTSISSSDYYNSTWGAVIGSSTNNTSSGLLLRALTTGGIPSLGSIHVVPVADYRGALVATYSADNFGGYFAVNQFNPIDSATYTRMYIDQLGNTGFGTTTPGYKLDVVGDIHSTNYIASGNIYGQKVSALSGSKELYMYNDGSTIKIDAYDYGASAALNVNIGGNGGNILLNGKVGIGTTAPSAKFQVVGGSDIWSGITLADSGGDRPTVGFHVSDNSLRGKIEINDVNGTGGDRLGLFAYNSGSLNEVMSIRGGGNVGIGTNNPNYPLVVSASGTSTGYGIIQQQIISGSNESGLSISNVGTGGRNYNLLSTNNNSGTGGGKFIIADSTAGSPRLTIDSAGNVGIGTTNPLYSLDVNGIIGVKGIPFLENGAGGAVNSIYTGASYLQVVNHDGTANLVTVFDNGFFGIGTTNPVAKLDVFGDSGDQVIRVWNSARGIELHAEGIYNPYITSIGSEALEFRAGSSNNQNYYFTSTGYVGIGNKTPTTTLHITSPTDNGVYIGVAGGVYPNWMGTDGLYVEGRFRAGQYLVGNDGLVSWGASQAYITGHSPFTGSDTYLDFVTGGIAATGVRMRINDDGNIAIGGGFFATSRVDISGPTDTYSSGIGISGTGTGARTFRTYISSAGMFYFDDFTATAHRLAISASGNVGFGIDPTQKLSVVGQGLFTASTAIYDPGDSAGPAIRIGYNSTDDYGYVVASDTGVVIKNLVLQPGGGNVSVGTSTPLNDAKFYIKGQQQSSGLFTAGLQIEQQYVDLGGGELIGAGLTFNTTNGSDGWLSGGIAGVIGNPGAIAGYPGGLAMFIKHADGDAAGPLWEAARISYQGYLGVYTKSPTSHVHINGSFATKVNKSTSTSVTVDASATRWYCTATSDATYTLPALSGITDRVYHFTNRAANLSGIQMTINTAGSDTIYATGGNIIGTIVLTPGDSAVLVADGEYWVLENIYS